MEVLMYHCRFCSHLNGTKDDNIARKCRCYFCSEIRTRTGVELETPTPDNATPRKGETSSAGGLWGISDEGEEVNEGKTAEGTAGNIGEAGEVRKSKVSVARRSEESSKGAIGEGWEDVKSRTD